MTKEETIKSALSYFDEGYACSQAVLLAFANQFNLICDTTGILFDILTPE